MINNKSVIQSKNIALVCHSLAILFMLVSGVVYALHNSYMSYHAAATAYSWHELSLGVQVLFQALINGAGSFMLLIALILILLLIIPFRQNQRWSLWAIPFIGTSAMLITLRAAIMVERNTQGNPPWEWLLVVISLFGIGLFFSLIKSD